MNINITPGIRNLQLSGWQLEKPYEPHGVEIWSKGYPEKAYLKLFPSGMQASMDTLYVGEKAPFWMTRIDTEYAVIRMYELARES